MPKSVLRAVLGRTQFTRHATRRTPHGASRLVQAMSAWLVKTQRAPSRHRVDARVCGHTTTSMHELSAPPSPYRIFGPQLQLEAHSHSQRHLNDVPGVSCSGSAVEECTTEATAGTTDDYEPEVGLILTEPYDTIMLEGDDTYYLESNTTYDCALLIGEPRWVAFIHIYEEDALFF